MKVAFDELDVQWQGVAPLCLHSGELANPLSPAAKRIKKLSSKRRKTDEDLLDLAKVEWEGSFYWSDDYGPCVPIDNVYSTTVNGARKSKMGKEATLGIFIEGLKNFGDAALIKLEYDGPRSMEELWGDGNSPFVYSKLVTLNRSRIVRTRPIFPQWSIRFRTKFDANVINRESVIKSMEDAGFYIGLLCHRRSPLDPKRSAGLVEPSDQG
jgi:hypothetical protein